MRLTRCFFLIPSSLLVLASASSPVVAQQPESSGLVGDLVYDLEDVQKKILDLAREIPVEKYDWRPGEGVRSVGEVLLHLSADNYLLPTLVGATPPAATGITRDYQTAQAYEQRKLGKDAIIQELEQSFAFVKKAIAETSDARLNETVDLFGRPASVRRLWVLTTTHVHEHLGQMIAYARSNGIVPPWSRQGG
jgi:uncharacterized damage-inducible protein DinB